MMEYVWILAPKTIEKTTEKTHIWREKACS